MGYSPVVAEAAENTAKKAGHSISELFAGTFAFCYEAEKTEEPVEIETEPVIRNHQIEVVASTESVQSTSAAPSNERVQYTSASPANERVQYTRAAPTNERVQYSRAASANERVQFYA